MKNLILPFLLLLTLVFSCRENDNNGVLEKNVLSYDVYVAGKENNKACYWKNNVLNYLNNGDNLSSSKIIVENNNIYILGKENVFMANYYFWKNNVKEDLRVSLGIPTTSPYWVLDMNVNGGDVYFVGYYDTQVISSNQRYVFCVWKNGVKTILNMSGSNIYQTSKINIFNNQTYISSTSGYYIGSTYYNIPNISWVCNFSKNINGIYFLYIRSGNLYYRNLSTNIEFSVGNVNYPNLGEGKIVSEENSPDLYISSYFGFNTAYYKNNSITTFLPNPSFENIKDVFILNNNLYLIKHQIDPYSSKVYINNIEILSISNTTSNMNNEFNSVFVVPN